MQMLRFLEERKYFVSLQVSRGNEKNCERMQRFSGKMAKFCKENVKVWTQIVSGKRDNFTSKYKDF